MADLKSNTDSKKSTLDDEHLIPAMEWLAEKMPGGFFIYRADDSQEILYANQATYRIFGCETEEEFKKLTGNTFRGMVHPEDIRHTQASIDEQIADCANNNMDYVVYRIIKKDGKIRWVDDYGHFTNLPGYGDVYYVFIGDITAKRAAQEEKERNAMLQFALQEAERANVAKTAFLSNMSHEIRTPMNAIIGLYNIALRNPNLAEETKDQLTKIGSSAKHLLSLINDILDLSRIESGRMTIKKDEFSFGDMLEQINTMIESQCEDKGIRYECWVTGHVDDYYVGDDMKLKQVIINILGNSVKFTKEGSVTFYVEETQRTDTEAMIRFTMKDTGVGMEKEYLPKIFEAFSQEVEGVSTPYGSTGLGMAITKNIVDMMKGTITVISEKDVGSEFTVTVPLGITHKTDYHAEATPDKLHVLIIDDDITACDHAQLVLKRIGIVSDYCLSGKEALKMYEKQIAEQTPYNLLLVDWKMPEWDGVEFTRQFREKYQEEKATIILTTYNWDEIMEEALDAGVDGFLAKPFFAKSVLGQIKEIMSQAKHSHREKKPRLSLSGRRILLAEDMEINAEIMIQILHLVDVETDRAKNGKEAIELFQRSEKNTYDAILMDVKMPVLGGLDATREIRALERPDAKSIPIIALTANAFDEDIQKSLEAGMNEHLSKPVEPDALFATLQRLIQS